MHGRGESKAATSCDGSPPSRVLLARTAFAHLHPPFGPRARAVEGYASGVLFEDGQCQAASRSSAQLGVAATGSQLEPVC